MPDQMEALKRRLTATLEERVRALRDQLDEDLRRRGESLHQALDALVADLPAQVLNEPDIARLVDLGTAGATAGDDQTGDVAGRLLAAFGELDDAGSQPELLDALLRAGHGFASRTAFLLTQPDAIAGWAGRGFDDQTPTVPDVRLPYDDGTAWSELRQTGGRHGVELEAKDRARFAAALGVPVAEQAVLVPFRLQHRLAGVLYADRHNGGALDGDALQVLTRAAALALETLGLRTAETAETAETSEYGESAETAEHAESSDTLETAETVETARPIVAEPEAEPEPEVPEPEPEAMSLDAAAFELTPEKTTAEIPLAEAETETPVEARDVEPDDTVTDFDLDDDLYEPETLELEPDSLEAPEDELEAAAEDLWADEGEETASRVDTDDATEPEPEPPLAPPPVPPDVGQKTVALDLGDLRPELATRETPVVAPDAAPEDAPVPAVEVPDFELDTPGVRETPGDAPSVLSREGMEEPVTAAMERPRVADPSEDPTLIASRGTVSEPPPPPPSAEMPKPPTAPMQAPDLDATRASSSQVVPPADVVGPGSAFSSAGSEATIPDGEEALHEEARRLARLLVSEIKLYNEELIEEGRRDGNIYARLKEDIDRSRQMYEERIDPRVRATEDYFVRELEQRLAGGDPAVLGLS